MPGEYYVNAHRARRRPRRRTVRRRPAADRRSAAADAADAAADAGRGGPGGAGDDQEKVNYAPTYYPGRRLGRTRRSRSPSALSQELLDINFNLLLVRIARITGIVTNADGTPVDQRQRQPDARCRRHGGASQIGVNFGGRIQWDGAFTIGNVAARALHAARARRRLRRAAVRRAADRRVSGGDLTGHHRRCSSPGATITGTVSFLHGGSTAPDFTQFRITAPSTDQSRLRSATERARRQGRQLHARAACRPART